MSKIWFIAQGQSIRGPFTSEEIEQFLENGGLSLDSLIWWKGEPAWVTVSHWKTNFATILKSLEPQQEKEWFLQHGTEHWGPLTKAEMIETLEKAFDATLFRVWKVGMDQWQSIYYFEDICVSLGIQKRVHSRVPMVGTATLELPNENIVANTVTVSEGGFGVQKTPLPAGHIVRTTIKSPVLPIPIRAHAEVRYSRIDGYTGLKFDNLTAEARSAILDYIRKFIKAA